jgi:hypothetical protein
LHDTVVHAVRISGRDVPDGVVFSASAPVCAAYWSVWIFSLFVALVMALIDVRHIRREFGLERAALLRESLGDDLASSSLQKNRKP